MKTSVQEMAKKVADTLVLAGSTFSEDKKEAYRHAIAAEDNPQAKWVLETILQNAEAAEGQKSPLCDDSGIPHLVLDVGVEAMLNGEMLEAIQQGVVDGLRRLPGRPMGIMGDDAQRLDQSGGLSSDSADVLPAPFLLRNVQGSGIKLHVLMFGGGPAIRAKTLRVFHKHNVQVVLDEIVTWAKEAVAQLGCSPCTLGVGIGRSHFEASSLMLQALVEGNYARQSEMEAQITSRVNEADIGPLGLHGRHSVLATFLKVGPQRASGVRIVCLRPCCCFEPRIASVEIQQTTTSRIDNERH